jgi:hypothetical protein
MRRAGACGGGVIAAPDLAQSDRRPNSRIDRGSCPGQVGSKKTRLARVLTRNTILAAASLVDGDRPQFWVGLNDRGFVAKVDAPRFTSAHKLRRAECFRFRATLDDLLSDEVRPSERKLPGTL